MTVRVEVQPELLAWAKKRSRAESTQLIKRFPKLEAWEGGKAHPTLKQLEDFARATHTPMGFLLLPQPPDEQVPLPDFRTFAEAALEQPSADLLDTLFLCEQRQEWYREYARSLKEERLSFVGSLTLNTNVEQAASDMQELLRFALDERGFSWADALRTLSERAENLGVLVMISGVVGSNTHRKLDPKEFRGFAIVDDLAPLVFINGSDTKAAQIFSLAHELAHLWLGESALSNVEVADIEGNEIERWCNQVAAEFLVPLSNLENAFNPEAPLTHELERLARSFRVSTLVIVRRIHDTGYLAGEDYWAAFEAERDRVLKLMGEGGPGGGNFYNTQPVRVSKRFSRAVITSTLEGRTLYRDAMRLLGVKKVATFQELSQHLGVG
ncbi:MAG: ImmA/IrrE family metallo-endopeptidase [Actinobacteria bacterium]|nr:ImmA/IrrE family metallo-endopeptidase [Actinomycetota bacterium]